MKLFTLLQGSLIVGANVPFGTKGERCDNIVQFFIEDNVIPNESRLIKKLAHVQETFFNSLEIAVKACNIKGERGAEDGIRGPLSEENISNKIQQCGEKFEEYIANKVPIAKCPNAHQRSIRMLKRVTKQMERCRVSRVERKAESVFRSGTKSRPTPEEREAKQEKKGTQREERQQKKNKKFENQTLRLEKQERKAEKSSVRQAKKAKKAEKNASEGTITEANETFFEETLESTADFSTTSIATTTSTSETTSSTTTTVKTTSEAETEATTTESAEAV